jgi:polyhydroxyalkanoate synthesis regulator phasin
MAGPEDMIVPLLHEMRAEISSRFDGVDGRLDLVERRLAKLEEQQVSYRQALSADSLLSKLVTGEFEERIEALEKRMRELEAQK